METPDISNVLAEINRENITQAYTAVFHSEAGKRVLFHMMEQANVYASAFAGADTNVTNFQLGMQAVGRRLIETLDAVNPRFYPQLLLDMDGIRSADEALAKSVVEKAKAAEDEEDSADEA